MNGSEEVEESPSESANATLAVVPEEAGLNRKIMKWLETQGTILELTVARKFLEALGGNSYERNVSHGRYYRDRDPITSENKFREIDVVVRTTPITRPSLSFSIWLILECKSRDKHPWIFYRSSELTRYSIRFEDAFLIMKNCDFDSAAIAGLRDVSIFKIGGSPFSTGGVAALLKAKDEATPTPRDEKSEDSRNRVRDEKSENSRNGVRDAILQVLSATEGISSEVGLDMEGLITAILVPIVVTKAPMFAVTLDDSGNPRLEMITRELVITRSSLDDGKLKYVWVVHESEIDALSREFAGCLPHIELHI